MPMQEGTRRAGHRTLDDPKGLSPRCRRRGAVVVYSIGAVVVVCGLTWASWSYVRANAMDDQQLTTHAIQTRSFSVVLKEKGELQAAQSTDIKSEVEGRATIISLIAEGTAAKKGDLLVELAGNEIEDRIRSEELREASSLASFKAAKTDLDIQKDKNASDIRKAALKVELAKLDLKKYTLGDWVQALKDAEVEIDRAEIMLERREQDLRDSNDLHKRKYITTTEFDEAKFNAKKAKWDLDKANRAQEVLEKYTHVKDLRQKESDVKEAEKELERARKSASAEEDRKQAALAGREKELSLTSQKLAKLRGQLSKCRIVAPGPGLVVYYAGGGGRHFMSTDSQIKEGATVYERQTIVTLVNTSRMNVAARIHESKTDKIRLGLPVSVQVEGIPGQVFRGTVTKIGVLAESQNRWINPDLKEYEVEIELDETEHPLKPGVTAVAEILVERVEDVVAIPVQAIFSKSGHNFVFRRDRSGVEPVEVKTGVAGTEWVQIEEGLTVGDQVLLAAGDEHMRLLPDLPPVRRAQMPPMRMPPPGMTGRPMQGGDARSQYMRGGGGKMPTSSGRGGDRSSRGMPSRDGAKSSGEKSSPASGKPPGARPRPATGSSSGANPHQGSGSPSGAKPQHGSG